MKRTCKLFSLFFTLSICCLLAGQTGASPNSGIELFAGEKGTIKISGGTAHIPVMKEMAKRIMSNNPDIQVSVAGGGSGVGIKQVGEGLVDIGNSGRSPKKEELEKYSLSIFKWAIDGVGIVVNPENRVQSLSSSQLQDIYAGKITNWKQLGGRDEPINVYTRDKSSGTRDVFWKKGLHKGEITAKAHFVVSNGAMKAAISQDPYGIGYVSVGHIDKSVAPVTLDGVAPTLDNIKKGSYIIARGLYSITNGEPTGLTKKFIDYLFTPEIQKLVSDKGFISVK